jgi:transposase-like protein
MTGVRNRRYTKEFKLEVLALSGGGERGFLEPGRKLENHAGAGPKSASMAGQSHTKR